MVRPMMLSRHVVAPIADLPMEYQVRISTEYGRPQFLWLDYDAIG